MRCLFTLKLTLYRFYPSTQILKSIQPVWCLCSHISPITLSGSSRQPKMSFYSCKVFIFVSDVRHKINFEIWQAFPIFTVNFISRKTAWNLKVLIIRLLGYWAFWNCKKKATACLLRTVRLFSPEIIIVNFSASLTHGLLMNLDWLDEYKWERALECVRYCRNATAINHDTSINYPFWTFPITSSVSKWTSETVGLENNVKYF